MFWTFTMSNSVAIAGRIQTWSIMHVRDERARSTGFVLRKRAHSRRTQRYSHEREAHAGRGFDKCLNVLWVISPPACSAEGWPCRRLFRLS